MHRHVKREMVTAAQKTSFVANVSHELKTPLTSIRMYAELSLKGIERFEREKKERYLNVILSESERLSRLIGNVLDFSKMENGKKSYHAEQVELCGLLRSFADAHSRTVEEAGQTLKLKLPDRDVIAVIDTDSLIQVLQNLVSNALKYAPDGKSVDLALLDIEPPTIRVIDHGKGIPKHCVQKIFDKFFRCNDELTADTQGSGLGLTIARKLMRDQNGDLSYQVEPDGGSCFEITLPQTTGRA